MKYDARDVHAMTGEVGRLLRCINAAMGCLSPLSKNVDERLAWHRLLDAFEGREPRTRVEKKD